MIRAARPSDAETVVDLILGSFDVELHEFMPMARRGAASYLALQLRRPWAYPDRQHLVFEEAGIVHGYCAAGTSSEGEGFLSYLCIAAGFRSRGVARDLIARWLSETAPTGSVGLDVFEHNEGARRLYRRLGFSDAGRTTWLQRELPPPDGTLRVRDWHTTHATLERYGFAEISLVDEDVDRLGLLGGHIVRCPDLDTFRDPALLARVAGSLPQVRRAFALVDETPPLGDERRVLTSIRMTTDPETLLLRSTRTS